MNPPLPLPVRRSTGSFNGDWRSNLSSEALVVESWSEGLLVGSLTIMACVTLANMRKGVLLHKLILLELLLAIPHGTFCFMTFRGYGWYLSSTAAGLYISCFVHNIVAWYKIKPFIFDSRLLFGGRAATVVSRIYLYTLALSTLPTLLQMVCNFLFFNSIYNLYESIRPTEFLFRDPWWLFSCFALFHVIRRTYGSSVINIMKRSPRFAILLVAICLSMVFTIMDILAVAIPRFGGAVDGINPYWKLTLIFKCLTDNIMLDDFKTELMKLGAVEGMADVDMQIQNVRHSAPSNDKRRGTSSQLEHATLPVWSERV